MITDLQTVARRLLFSAAGLSQADRQFLQDFARTETRYQLVALQRLVYAAQRSARPEDREAIAECIRGYSLLGVPVVRDLAIAGDLETRAQGDADCAVRIYERQRDRVSRAVALEKITAHGSAIRGLADAIQANGAH